MQMVNEHGEPVILGQNPFDDFEWELWVEFQNEHANGTWR